MGTAVIMDLNKKYHCQDLSKIINSVKKGSVVLLCYLNTRLNAICCDHVEWRVIKMMEKTKTKHLPGANIVHILLYMYIIED